MGERWEPWEDKVIIDRANNHHEAPAIIQKRLDHKTVKQVESRYYKLRKEGKIRKYERNCVNTSLKERLYGEHTRIQARRMMPQELLEAIQKLKGKAYMEIKDSNPIYKLNGKRATPEEIIKAARKI